MGLGNENDEVISGLVQSMSQLIKILQMQNDASCKMWMAQQRFNHTVMQLIAQNTTYGSEAEREAFLNKLAVIKKEMETYETDLILKNLLPPLPPGNTGGSAPGA